MNIMRIHSVGIRALMILLWTGLIILFLYLPYFYSLTQGQKSISVLAWPTNIDPQAVIDFEKETGIKVYMNYFEDYGELFVKLRATNGEGYDLVMPSDSIGQLLIQEGLLKTIDKTKLPFWSSLNPDLLGLYYDPDNAYTVPYFWGIFGLGIDTEFFGGVAPRATWSLLFDEKAVPAKIGMLYDVRELMFITAQYLFGKLNDMLTDAQVTQIQQLLLKQKRRVAAYVDDTRAAFLLTSKTSPVVLTISYEMGRAKRYCNTIDFLIPEEGGFIIIDNLAIPKGSHKDELVYTFINYIFRHDVVKQLVEKNLFYPALPDAVPADYFSLVPLPTKKQFQKADFFKPVFSDEQLNDSFIVLKA